LIVNVWKVGGRPFPRVVEWVELLIVNVWKAGGSPFPRDVIAHERLNSGL